MIIETDINGYLVISDIVKGYLITKKYSGYTQKDAIKMFKEYLK